MSEKPVTPRKTLKLKAGEQAPAEQPTTSEASPELPNSATEAPPQPEAPAATAPLPSAETKPSWTEDDEANLRNLMARRKAAGYQTRGRDVSGQRIKASDIKPNPGTVAAVIVALVEGTITRAELLLAMSQTSFPHPKAKPQDQGWCQGYIAGAIRSGFLTVVDEAPEGSGEAC